MTEKTEKEFIPSELHLFEMDNERRRLRRNRMIYLNEDVDDCSAGRFVEDMYLMITEGKEPITVMITSGGGDVFAGMAMIRAIKKAQANGIKVIGEVYGQALSMAFFILQCCDKRIMGKYCSLMCHGVSTTFEGDMKNVEAESKLLKRFQAELSELVAERNTSKNKKCKEPGFWFAMLEDNTPQFYDSNDSLKNGLIDNIES